MKLKPIVTTPITKSSSVSKFAVVLGDETEKTIEVQLTKMKSDSPMRIAAMQLDDQNNVITSRVLNNKGDNAEFKFSTNGELWLTKLDDEADISTGNVSFGLKDVEVSLGEKQAFKMNTITNDAKARSVDDV